MPGWTPPVRRPWTGCKRVAPSPADHGYSRAAVFRYSGSMRSGQHRRRGIYLLPAMLTVANLFCGFSSMIQSSLGALEVSAILIILAGVLDGLDVAVLAEHVGNIE